MNDSHDARVADVFCAVVERQACMFCVTVPKDEIPEAVLDCVRASINFHGHVDGTLTLMAPNAVALELAANVLGIDPEDAQVAEHASDALGELMNVSVGQLLTATFAGDKVFDLGSPQVEESIPDAEWRAFAARESTVPLSLEDHPVLLEFELRGVGDGSVATGTAVRTRLNKQ